MPDLHISAFTAATDGLRASDLMHLQRTVGGTRQDFAARSSAVFGVAVQTAKATSIGTSTTAWLSAPGANKMHYILQGFLQYNPGSTNTGTTDVVILEGSFDAAPAQLSFALADTVAAGSAGGFISYGGSGAFSSSVPVTYTRSGGTGSNGTFDIWVQYFIAEWPS